jgi:hypothetical protein
VGPGVFCTTMLREYSCMQPREGWNTPCIEMKYDLRHVLTMDIHVAYEVYFCYTEIYATEHGDRVVGASDSYSWGPVSKSQPGDRLS